MSVMIRNKVDSESIRNRAVARQQQTVISSTTTATAVSMSSQIFTEF